MRQPNRKKEATLSRPRLLELLHYDPETGDFTWLKSNSNRAPKGTIAGSRHERGVSRYICIGIDGHDFYAHRLAWFYMTAQWPEEEIDHKDRDGWNNRWTNLRAASTGNNQSNTKRRTDNATGVKGVTYNAHPRHHRNPYMVWLNGHYVGCYPSLEEAKAARERVASVVHGQFYREK